MAIELISEFYPFIAENASKWRNPRRTYLIPVFLYLSKLIELLH
jgi:hypothetical protein